MFGHEIRSQREKSIQNRKNKQWQKNKRTKYALGEKRESYHDYRWVVSRCRYLVTKTPNVDFRVVNGKTIYVTYRISIGLASHHGHNFVVKLKNVAQYHGVAHAANSLPFLLSKRETSKNKIKQIQEIILSSKPHLHHGTSIARSSNYRHHTYFHRLRKCDRAKWSWSAQIDRSAWVS